MPAGVKARRCEPWPMHAVETITRLAYAQYCICKRSFSVADMHVKTMMHA